LPEFSPEKKDGGSRKRREAAREAAKALLGEPELDIAGLKNRLALKHGTSYLRNSEILAFVPRGKAALRQRLLKSPTRTLSGVSPVAIMPRPWPCPGRCIYCPKGENAPQSYTGFEPATMRAIQCGYSAARQVGARLKQYSALGHETGKCHLIVMGGTFLCSPAERQQAFMKEAYEALNGRKARTLPEAIDANGSAPHRAIGVTFETRPDFGYEKEADAMLAMGGTQVELGVQTLSDLVYRKVRRGHTVADVVRSAQVLRDCGFKLCFHMMPGLFATPSQDAGCFGQLFSDERFRPDMLKIYPVLVMKGTPLYDMWKRGEFEPYSTEQAAEVVAEAMSAVPPYVRIPRVQRDIPSPLVAAGVKNSNLRQIVDERLRQQGKKCRCIRCREIGSVERSGAAAGKLSLSLGRIDYSASGGREVFLSFEDKEKDLLAGFLRLRAPGRPHRHELKGSAVVRELHVYGQEASIGEGSARKMQHHGLGERLLREAEEIARDEFGLGKLSVLSGPGARGYYRRLGYSLAGAYMQKEI
jgi:elongator complex protein 3